MIAIMEILKSLRAIVLLILSVHASFHTQTKQESINEARTIWHSQLYQVAKNSK